MKNPQFLSNNKVVLTIKDHSVSGEEFQLCYNEEYDMLVTTPQPAPEELGRYYKSEKYISHTDSRRSISDKLYQLVKKFMLKQKLNWINKETARAGRLLDIGAGTGDFSLAAKRAGWNAIGVEPNLEARKMASSKGVEIFSKTKNFEAGSFDVITMWHVLEHVVDLEEQINEISRLLKPEGLLIIAVPNFKSCDAQVYGNYWAAYDVPRHLWHFSKNSISRLFQKQNFQVRKILPLKFDAFYVSLLSEKYQGNSFIFINAFINGIESNRKAKKTGEYSSLVYFLRK